MGGDADEFGLLMSCGRWGGELTLPGGAPVSAPTMASAPAATRSETLAVSCMALLTVSTGRKEAKIPMINWMMA